MCDWPSVEQRYFVEMAVPIIKLFRHVVGASVFVLEPRHCYKMLTVMGPCVFLNATDDAKFRGYPLTPSGILVQKSFQF